MSLGRSALRELMDADPALRDALFAGVAGALRRLTQQIEELHFLDLSGRLATRLGRLARAKEPEATSVTLDWPYTQTELAAMIGGARQTVNRLLSELVDAGPRAARWGHPGHPGRRRPAARGRAVARSASRSSTAQVMADTRGVTYLTAPRPSGPQHPVQPPPTRGRATGPAVNDTGSTHEGRSGMHTIKATFGRLAVVAAAIAFLVIEAAPRIRF